MSVSPTRVELFACGIWHTSLSCIFRRCGVPKNRQQEALQPERSFGGLDSVCRPIDQLLYREEVAAVALIRHSCAVYLWN